MARKKTENPSQRIWVTYHKDEQMAEYGLHEDDVRHLFATHKTPEEKNINHLNPVYSEMVTMWYVWKNNLKTQYVGFEHYRRHFDGIRLPQKGECQVYKIMDFLFESVYRQYARCHKEKDMEMMLQCVNNKYGAENAYTKNIRESHFLVSNCCFIMQWTDFVKMCEFLFPLLDDFAAMCGISNTNVAEWRKKAVRDFGENDKTEYQTRILSFLAERLISAWIFVNLTPYVEGYKLAVVHYNTPNLLEKALMSLKKNAPGFRVCVLDNSNKKPFKQKMPCVEIIDNTKGQKIRFDRWAESYPDREASTKNDYASAKHTYSIQWLIDHTDEPFILMDSDVLVCGNIAFLIDPANAFVGEIGKDNYCDGFPIKRVLPILCYLNVPALKEAGVTYFNAKYMFNLVSNKPNNRFDTGAWLYKEAVDNNLPWREISLVNYVKHLWHGSWIDDTEREEKWLKENEALWK